MLVLTFHNDKTATDTKGNYDVVVYINKEPIHWGRVENHLRSDGWLQLLKMFTEKESL